MIHLLHPPSSNDETRRKTLCGRFIDSTLTAEEDRAYVDPGPDVRMCDACRGGRTSSGHGLQRFAVFAVRQSKGQTIWVRAGIAYENKDGSMEVHLDVLPIDGKLHMRHPTKGETTDPGEG